MLGDRDYMNRASYENQRKYDRAGLHCLFAIIALNVLFMIMPLKIKENLVFSVQKFLSGDVITILSSLFIHADFWHIAFNMYSLYLFGSIAAPILGAKKFTALYFTAGIFGNALFMLVAITSNNASGYLLGASGAVMGVIIAAAMIMPQVEFRLLFVPFPMQLKTLALVFIGIEIFSQIFFAQSSNVAYTAHLGGFAGGYIFMILFARNQIAWNPLSRTGTGTGNSKPRTTWTFKSDPRKQPQGEYRFKGTPYSEVNKPVTQKELDSLLDKISREGINALSEDELARLKQAREQMRGGNNSR